MFTPPEDKISLPDQNWHGAGIAWHHSLNSCCIPVKNVNERFTGVKLQTETAALFVISAYLPTRGKDTEFLECIQELSNYVTVNKDTDDIIIIGFDSNCSETSSSRRIKALDRLCEELRLEKLKCESPTFHHNNGISEANLDYFLVPRACSSLFTRPRNICTLENILNLSGHDVVTSSIHIVRKTPPEISENRFLHTYTPFVVKQVCWDDVEQIQTYKHLTNEVLKEMEKFFSNQECIPLKCKLYSDLLVSCAEHALPCQGSQTKPKTKKFNPQRFSFRQNRAWQQFNKSYKQWKSAGKPRCAENRTFRQFKEARANFQRVRRYEDNLQHIKFNNKLMMTSITDRNYVFKLMKAVRGKQSRGTPTSKLITPTMTYLGLDTLEGFTADAEALAKNDVVSEQFDTKFYQLCRMDNMYIFEINTDSPVKIPPMSLADLNRILSKEMKLGKAADIYKLRVEHLRNAGNEAKICILNLLNDIIRNISSLACPQVKKGIGSAVYKGKKKPLTDPNSFRRITVTPQLGNILDRYVDPVAEAIFARVQSADQLGFTKNISYLMGSVERGECQRWALDRKITCFGVSLDGKAAFPSVDREILVRELFSIGEAGDYLEYSRYTYTNTTAHMRQSGLLSREFREEKGKRQGHKRAAGNFKTYINPCLTSSNSSQLGFNIGPICITAVCIADDTYLLSDDPRKLQAAINIISHYSSRYRITFGAEKTKITVTGSVHDMNYYRDIPFWTLNGHYIEVSEDNEHLGMVVSGVDEESKNIDKNITAARNALFAMLGPVFLYKCKLSPTVQSHLWRVYIKPVLTSGLASLPIRPANLQPIRVFHHKILRGFLKLSPYSPTAPLYFLLGELPIEATLHLDIFSLFWTIWSNPKTTVHHIIKYVLKMSTDSSLTWSVHVRLLTQLYGLADPLSLMEGNLWTKQAWKDLCITRVRAQHERALRANAASNYKLKYLNVQSIGLNGQAHISLHSLITTQDIRIARPHLKMLAGDYMCHYNLYKDRGSDPQCRLCPASKLLPETITHILVMCHGTCEARSKMWPELLNTTKALFPENKILDQSIDPDTAAQFILDCTSLNLPNNLRISNSAPDVTKIFVVARQYCYAVHSERIAKLTSLKVAK